MNLARYRKFVVALIPVALVILGHYIGVGSFWYNTAVMALGALGVYIVPNAA